MKRIPLNSWLASKTTAAPPIFLSCFPRRKFESSLDDYLAPVLGTGNDGVNTLEVGQYRPSFSALVFSVRRRPAP